MNKSGYFAALFASVSALSFAAQANAQSAPPAPPADNTAVNEIVVTGSRVIANGNNSPTPVTVMSTQQLMAVQPTTVADGLNNLPAFVGSRTQTTTQGNSGGNTGANYLSLRNLGDTRTLILYDGHRVAPTSTAGNVDVNQIPQLLLQRVDVVTGGASAVYGSDAVSGVVNFVTDTKFNGFKANARTGISQYGDDRTFDGSFAVGKSILGGKGHVEFSYEYLNDPGIFNKNNRPWFQKVIGMAGQGTTQFPYVLTQNERLSNTSFGGVITSGPFNGAQFAQNGVLSPFVNGQAIPGVTGIQQGGDGGYYYTASLKAMLQSHQVFARGDYDFSDTIHGWVQAVGTLNHTSNLHQFNEVRGTTNFGVLGYNNAFLQGVTYNGQPLYNAGCVSGSACTFNYGKMITLAPTFQPESHESNYMVLGGLDGSIANYKWNVGYTHSYGVQQTSNLANLNSGRLLAAEDAVMANGQIVCHAALVNPAYSNCKPLNLFGPTSESQAAINYILAVTTYYARNQFDDASGSFSGAPFSTWAGPVNMAVSAEWRNTRYNLTSNAQPSDHPDCYGIEWNCTATSPLWVSNVVANRSPVHQSVWEVAYETDIPLIKDMPFVQSFNLNGAVRYTDYSNSGGVDTWKIGVDWHVNDELTLRATRSRDIRAPNLNDLFAPVGVSPNGYTDVHTGIQQQAFVYSQGNANLKPEDADTTTAGLVYKPHFIPRFSLAVDGYRITLNNAISSVSGTNKAVQQLCEASGGTSIYCSLFDRPLPFSNTTAANFPTAVYTKSLNIASIDTYGMDFEANYAARIFDHGSTWRLLASYQPHLVYNLGPAGIIDMGDAAYGQGNSDPSWRITGLVNFDVTDQFKVEIMEQWRNGMKMSGISSEVYAQKGIGSIAYTALNLTYDMKTEIGQMQFYFNIKNLFNQQPVPYANYINGTVPGLQGGFVLGDDPIGRYFTLGVHYRM
jgi:outer membrane receptor protein involved in Fe transport